jgi:hypothetical protein
MSTSWFTRSELKKAKRISERGDPYASLVFFKGRTSVLKLLNLILAILPSIKLYIYFFALIGILLSSRRVSSIWLLTLLKAPLRLNATSVTTLFFSQAWLILLVRIRSIYSIVHLSLLLNYVSRSRLYISI